jgi:hypothetical protein
MAGNFVSLTLGSLFKGSRQPESRRVGNVSNWPNLSRTAAIDVLFSINFDVVFDFISRPFPLPMFVRYTVKYVANIDRF